MTMPPENLKHYLSAWTLTDAKPLAQTATSDVYTVRFNGEIAVLKLLTPMGHEERSGAVALTCFNGHGAVRLLRHDDHAHLLEYAGDNDLVGMVKNGEDEQATVIIADVLNQLHSAYTGTPPDGLYRLERWFRSLFNKAEQDRQAGIDSIYRRGAKVARVLLDNPREERVLHGDIHHENIRHHPVRGWLAFDPKGLYGERTYDTANTLCNPVNMTELVKDSARFMRNAEILARHLYIELSRLLSYTYAYACLSASWSIEGGYDPSLAISVAEIVEPHITLP